MSGRFPAEGSSRDFSVKFPYGKTEKARKIILGIFPGKIAVYIPDKSGRGRRDEKRGKIRNLFHGKKRGKFPGFFRKLFPFSFWRTRALRPSCRVFLPPAMLRTQDADSSGHARIRAFPAGTKAPCRRRLFHGRLPRKPLMTCASGFMRNSRRNSGPALRRISGGGCRPFPTGITGFRDNPGCPDGNMSPFPRRPCSPTYVKRKGRG